jgi:NitT/TauT family transport system substrate-binding protein
LVQAYKRGEKTVKKKHLLIMFTIFTLILAACGSKTEEVEEGNNQEAEEDSKEKIRIGYVNILSLAPAIIAENQQLMEEQGLESEFYSFSNGPDLYKALSSGKLDMAYAGVPPAVNWVSRGAEVKAIAKVSDGKFGLLTKPDAGIEEPADLKGKKIGSVVQGSGADLLLRGFILPEGNLTEEDVNILQMQMPVMEQAVTKGSIDAAIAGEPYLTFAELRGLEVVKEVPDPALIVLATESYLKDHSEAVGKFIEGHKASISFIKENEDQAAEILVKSFNVPEITAQDGKVWTPEEVLKEALERHTFNYEISDSDFEFYQQIADVNYELKMIEQPFDIKTLFDTSWIQ